VEHALLVGVLNGRTDLLEQSQTFLNAELLPITP